MRNLIDKTKTATPAPAARHDLVQLTNKWLGTDVRNLSPEVIDFEPRILEGGQLMFDAALGLLLELRFGLSYYLSRNEPDADDKTVREMADALYDRLFDNVLQPFLEWVYRDRLGIKQSPDDDAAATPH